MQHTPITRRSVLAGAAALAANAALAGTPTAENWTFELGQLVSHKDQPFLSMVLARSKTRRGDEVYGIRRLRDDVPVSDLMMLSGALVPIADCDAEAVRTAEHAWETSALRARAA
ncbi:hypothetical protein CK215_04240 [Mesorhizobium sp. WSM3864]|uniref:hypothetical protein n=1 Tax=Mesorhizobium sp. WSM3864 TaxID=2029404 RepID=UPI000BAFBC12|nr:hypothetical protein [Mesorhizobium sp. WSM3864]PBB93193.1 hypothetical protein CK215_04240 [Mesorhizobium sp. WSM3864]